MSELRTSPWNPHTAISPAMANSAANNYNLKVVIKSEALMHSSQMNVHPPNYEVMDFENQHADDCLVKHSAELGISCQDHAHLDCA